MVVTGVVSLPFKLVDCLVEGIKGGCPPPRMACAPVGCMPPPARCADPAFVLRELGREWECRDRWAWGTEPASQKGLSPLPRKSLVLISSWPEPPKAFSELIGRSFTAFAQRSV